VAEELPDKKAMASDGNKPPDNIDERWKPPTDWTDVRRVRDWLQLVIQANSGTADMLESVVPLLREGVKIVQEAMPPSPDETAGPPQAELKAEKKLVERLLDDRVGVNRWKPNWANVHDVRNWLTLHAQSSENFATMMENFAIMLRGMGQTLREARPPLPIVEEDTPSEEPKK
jgi:hypothetical protein